jgi:hypothetical protein
MVSLFRLEERDGQSQEQLRFAASIVIDCVTVDFFRSNAFHSYYAVLVNFHVTAKICVQL